MIRARRFGHVALGVHDLDACARFYTDVLGFEYVNRLDRPRAVFLTLGVQHHDIALFEVGGSTTEVPNPHRAGLHHLALQVDDVAALKEAHATLRRHGVTILRAVDHGTTHSVYFSDPGGNRLELYCDIGDDGLARARGRTTRSLEEFPALDPG